jgi:cytochrome P450
VRQGLDRTADVLRDAFPAGEAGSGGPGGGTGSGGPGEEARSRSPAPGSALAHLLAAEPALFDDPTLTKNLILVFRLAYGDLTGLFDWLFKMLSDHPECLVRLREEGPATPSVVTGDEASASNAHPPALAVRIVMETLRLEQSEFLYRRVVRPVRHDDVLLPAGWLLRVCIQESHRSADVFEEPDRFDPDRFARRAFSRMEYSPFGLDNHACMGARLALSLGSVFVEELARFDWEVLRDGPIVRDGNRHRYHWRPNPRLGVRISPVAAFGVEASATAPRSEEARERSAEAQERSSGSAPSPR